MEQQDNPEIVFGRGSVRHTETGEILNIFDEAFERVPDALPLGEYEHFKSTPESRRHYRVDIVVRHVETGEQLVVYRPLYPTDCTLPSARPLAMFIEPVEKEGRLVPRFQFVE